MLINCDVKSLEVVTAAELANDEILKDELRRKLDTHALNQERFRLPSRVVAKRFIFKLLYGATAFGYAQDTDFTDVGYSEKDWQRVIDEFYAKYKGIATWHTSLLEAVRRTGRIEIPSGRHFDFVADTSRGYPKWPLTKIKNYPVQGFGADLVLLARIEFNSQFLASGLEGQFIQTIHDSLVVDCPSKNVDAIAKMLFESVAKVPHLCEQEWGYKFSLPLTSEIQIGQNKFDMKELTIN